ncbi:hypothetical protein D9757_010655 [Collybiopsis confluens]|uniref:Oxidase ustYa n=1 Tax=Collybiopsis confluens TaxID=2823264 RepID=A0A8H5GMR0_9AGAR|nr:hypothetical protein D9757_010655 [Collybiopsis confluens]
MGVYERVSHLRTLTLISLALVNAAILVGLLVDTKKKHDYTYIGADYPVKMPLPPIQEVQMTLYESVYYSLNGSQPTDLDEWDTLTLLPKGLGRVRLGPESRTFVLTYYHQRHCLRMIQNSLIDQNDPGRLTTSTLEHMHHCFNYLRQTLLCEAADSLEKGDFLERDYEMDRTADTLVCRDWEAIFEVTDENLRVWKDSSHSR